jgi:hypothetical protein
MFVSAAALKSRFPRLVVGVFSGKPKGVSDYTSRTPANPMHVFGGDIWRKVDELRELAQQFMLTTGDSAPSLEYNFFFWLINRRKMQCVLVHRDRLWMDSIRDVQRLLEKMDSNP